MLKLNAFGKEYDLELEENRYENNNRLFYWLVDKKDWEYFSDITTNYTDIDLDDDECLLNNDFLSCFDNKICDCLRWLVENKIASGLINRDWVWGFKVYKEM